MTGITKNKKIFYVFISLIVIICVLIGALFYTIKKYTELEMQNAFLSIENEMLKNPIDDTATTPEDNTQLPHSDVHDIEGLSAYQKLAQGQPINILIVGDSIATYPWDIQVQAYLQEKYGSAVTIDNKALTGSSSYAGYVAVKKLLQNENIAEATTYDLAIICYGQNDDDIGFSTNYEALIHTILSNYEGCNIVCIQEASQMDYTDKMLAIANIADYYQLQLADTIASSSMASGGNIALLTEDNVHPNEQGTAIYAQTVETTIDEAVINNIGKKSMPSPIDTAVYDLAEFKEITADQFHRADKDYYLELDQPISAVLGYDLITVLGDNGFRIIVDGTTEYSIQEDGFLSSPVINLVGHAENGSYEKIQAQKSILITFNTNPQADKFNGIYLSNSIIN